MGMGLVKKFVTVTAGAALALSGIAFVATSAHAEDSTTALLNEALTNSGTTTTDPALLSELEQSLAEAIDAGLVDPEVIADPGGTLDEQLAEQEQLWDDSSAQWKAAFETIRADFETCRSGGGQSTGACARTLGFRLQIAHAEAELAAYDSKLAAIALLPESEQAAALAQLEEEQASLQARLDRASAKLAAVGTLPSADAAALGRLNSVAGQLKARGESLPEAATGSNPGASRTPNTVTVTPGAGKSNKPETPGSAASNGRGNAANNR